MSLVFGADVQAVHVGGVAAAGVYLGDVKVWPVGGMTASPPVTTTNSPFSVAISTDGATLYVAEFAKEKVSEWDAATLTQKRVLDLPGFWPRSMDVSSDGSMLVVTGVRESNVIFVDTASFTVAHTVAASPPVGGSGASLGECKYSPDGSRVYVLNPSGVVIDWVDTQTYTLGTPITSGLQTGTAPQSGLVVTTDTVFGQTGSASMAVIDIATSAETLVMINNGGGQGGCTSPDKSTLYVFNTNGTVTVVDAATAKAKATTIASGIIEPGVVLHTINTAQGPAAMSTSPDGTKLYVVCGLDGALPSLLQIFDTTTFSLLQEISTGGRGAQGIAVSGDGTSVYVANYGGKSLVAIRG